ncbi:hypothetical protein T484DRAFT_1753835 [Baffinella frigidus]|nr:hypothetical protein T484DRAFT_1753835 [Cryptophyta sp. CCMP2293]
MSDQTNAYALKALQTLIVCKSMPVVVNILGSVCSVFFNDTHTVFVFAGGLAVAVMHKPAFWFAFLPVVAIAISVFLYPMTGDNNHVLLNAHWFGFIKSLSPTLTNWSNPRLGLVSTLLVADTPSQCYTTNHVSALRNGIMRYSENQHAIGFDNCATVASTALYMAAPVMPIGIVEEVYAFFIHPNSIDPFYHVINNAAMSTDRIVMMGYLGTLVGMKLRQSYHNTEKSCYFNTWMMSWVVCKSLTINGLWLLDCVYTQAQRLSWFKQSTYVNSTTAWILVLSEPLVQAVLFTWVVYCGGLLFERLIKLKEDMKKRIAKQEKWDKIADTRETQDMQREYDKRYPKELAGDAKQARKQRVSTLRSYSYKAM